MMRKCGLNLLKTLQNNALTLKHLRLVHDLDFFSEIDRWISLKCDMMSDNGHLPAPSGLSNEAPDFSGMHGLCFSARIKETTNKYEVEHHSPAWMFVVRSP